MDLKSKLRGVDFGGKRTRPLWDGPGSDTPNGGVTQSLLSRFCCCRERFRLHAMEGLRPQDGFSHKIAYGNMWHVCEEAYAREVGKGSKAMVSSIVAGALHTYTQILYNEYRYSQEQIVHWSRVCRVQFPLYVAFWDRHPEVRHRTSIAQEQVFDVPYLLPSGRTVRLRGKFDGIELVGRGSKAGIYLFETKTKGDIREVQMQRQLTFDIQVGFYLAALTQDTGIKAIEEAKEKVPVTGVRYNVIRRPLSGGTGTIRQHKPSKSKPNGESADDFYLRVQDIIASASDTYFMRWDIDISAEDIRRFRTRFLDPILEQLCSWYEWVSKGDPWRNYHDDENVTMQVGAGIHWQHPFGIVNSLNEGGASDLDSHLETGSEVGLVRAESLFTELT